MSHLVPSLHVGDDRAVWRSKRPEPALDRETVDGIIRKLMDMDAKLDRILDRLEEEDDEAQEDEP